MTYHDRGRDLKIDGITAGTGGAARPRNLPRAQKAQPQRHTPYSLFGDVSDIDVVMQLVEQAETLHKTNPDEDISMGGNGQWEVSLVNAPVSAAIEGKDQAA